MNFLPPLPIKLGIMKQSVKSFPKHGDTFKYLRSKFSQLPEAKLKECILVCPDIQKLMTGVVFEKKMENIERAAWTSFKEIVRKFFGNHKDLNFKHIVGAMLKNFKDWAP